MRVLIKNTLSTQNLVFAQTAILSIFYDWVGEALYYCGEMGGEFVLWKVLPVFTDEVTEVYRGGSITSQTQVQLAVDPFRGYVILLSC